MTRVRPCKRGCGYPAIKGRQFCSWHALMREPAHVQRRAAEQRLEAAFPPGGQAEHRARIPKGEWPDGERWCAGCQSFVPLFYTSGSRCKACASSAAHARRVETTYGISAEEYDRIFALQRGRCAICNNRPRTQRLAVDHDHTSGEVRGLLCKRCNHDLLGGGHDSVDLLWRAIKYLLSPPASFGPIFTDKVALAALDERLRIQAHQRRSSTVQVLPPPF